MELNVKIFFFFNFYSTLFSQQVTGMELNVKIVKGHHSPQTRGTR